MKKKLFWIIPLALTVILLIGGGTYFYTTNKQRNITISAKDKTKSKISRVTAKKPVPKKDHINIVAIGDSLTEGIGDTKKGGGGYVTRLEDKVSDKYHVKTDSQNFGVSGNISSQIIDRISFDQKIHDSLPKADIITVTVGGNDFMHLVKKKGMDLTEKDIAKEQTAFDQRLGVLLADIRHYNANAPIYLIGIYNPFSIYLANVKDAKSSFIKWGQGSQ